MFLILNRLQRCIDILKAEFNDTWFVAKGEDNSTIILRPSFRNIVLSAFGLCVCKDLAHSHRNGVHARGMFWKAWSREMLCVSCAEREMESTYIRNGVVYKR